MLAAAHVLCMLGKASSSVLEQALSVLVALCNSLSVLHQHVSCWPQCARSISCMRFERPECTGLAALTATCACRPGAAHAAPPGGAPGVGHDPG